ncbi:hypothetical protein [Alienimonas californiensis]|uniref:Uncharacterized protein n=1 Tax=Alienimonas californiensis TaxID=2527989 RepID=A0A517P7Y8_9PLAN|nr:hypothetical protein [Alienimonas californiensis]QDT15497.1 hypothetical protein CA12_15820 [Alienimonas californiensis]
MNWLFPLTNGLGGLLLCAVAAWLAANGLRQIRWGARGSRWAVAAGVCVATSAAISLAFQVPGVWERVAQSAFLREDGTYSPWMNVTFAVLPAAAAWAALAASWRAFGVRAGERR